MLGGTGFIGRRLVPGFEPPADPSAWRRATPGPTENSSVEFVRCDLESGEGVDRALEGADLANVPVHGMAEGTVLPRDSSVVVVCCDNVDRA